MIIGNPLDPEPHNDQMSSLFVPMFSHFAGTEYDFGPLKANADLRYLTNIPYQKMDLSYDEINALFFDLTFRTNKSFNDQVQYSLNCLNLFNNQSPVPAFGEHSGNGQGTLSPEGRRIYAGVAVDWR